MKILKIFLLFCSAVAAVAQPYILPKMPRVSSPQPGDLIPIWHGTNLYGTRVSDLGVGSTKVDSYGGSATNLNIAGSLNMTNYVINPLVLDPVNYRVGLFSIPLQPLELTLNTIRIGSRDGPSTLHARSANTGKRISFTTPDYPTADCGWGQVECSTNATGQYNSLELGYGQAGTYGVNEISFYTTTNVTGSDYTRYRAMTILSSTTGGQRIGIGTSNPNTNALLHLSSNTKFLLLPQFSNSDITNLIYNAVTTTNVNALASGMVFGTFTNRVGVFIGTNYFGLPFMSDFVGLYQPLNSDLSAISGVGSSSYGRNLLPLANSSAALTYLNAQTLNSELTSLSSITGTTYGHGFLTNASSAVALTYIGAQAASADLAAIASLGTTSVGRGLLNQASATTTRAYIGIIPSTPSNLTDAATIATDASLANSFRVTLGGNRTLGNPTNPTSGQRVIWQVTQDSTGTRTLAADTAFAFGVEITSFAISTVANKKSFIEAIYDGGTSKWYVIGIKTGY